MQNRIGDTIKMPEMESARGYYTTDAEIISEADINEVCYKLADVVESYMKKWVKDDNFFFQLPTSEFDHKRETPIIKYLDPKAVVDNIEVKPFSIEQIESIAKQGTFVVNSKLYSIPYTWQINPSVYKGREKRWKTFIQMLSSVWQQIYHIPKRFYDSSYFLSFKYVIGEYYWLLKNLVNIFIGVKSIKKSFVVDPYIVMETERQMTIQQKYGKNYLKQLYDFITISPLSTNQVDSNKRYQNMEALRQIQRKFQIQWAQVQQDWIDELSLIYTGWQYEQKIIQKRYQVLYSIKVDVSDEIMSQLRFILQETRKIEIYQRKLIRTSSQIQQKIATQIRAQNPIKSQYFYWYSQQQKRRKAPLLKANQQLLLEQLSKQLKTVFFKQYVQYFKNYDLNYSILSQIVSSQNPQKYFTQEYRLFPPYQIQQSTSYGIKNIQYVNHDTRKNFWLIKLYYQRIKVYTKNIFFYVIRDVCSGQGGLRVLFGKQKFYSQYGINQYSGETGWMSYNKTTPIITSIKQQAHNISQNRKKFQDSPDNGILKKSYLRVFNLIHQYIIIGLFYIGLWFCVIKPLFCLFVITLGLTLALFSCVISTFIVVFRYLWNILIKNTQPIYPKVVDWFPIITITLGFAVSTIRLFLTIFTIIIIHPLLSVIILLFALIQFSISTIYNEIALFLIKSIGRSPVGQSSLAWKIDGPGISKNYVRQMNPDDIYILFQSQCQKIQYEIMKQQIFDKLNHLNVEACRFVQPIRLIFKASIGTHAQIQESINYYVGKLNKQISQHTKNYPSLDSSIVRFTQDQLNEYTGNCIELVKTFMNNRSYSDLYKYFNMKRKKPEKLVIKIWERIFRNEHVFQAYEGGQERFRMIDSARDQGTIKNFIGRQQGFKKKGHKTWKYNRSAVNKNINQYPQYFTPVTHLLGSITSNTGYSTCNSKTNIKFSILINPYINQISCRYKQYIDKKNK